MQLTVTSMSVPLVLQSGKTALHVAARNNHVDVVTKLLEDGADPNVKDSVSTVYPSQWCSLTLFIVMLSLLRGEFLGRVFLSVHLYNNCLDGWSP